MEEILKLLEQLGPFENPPPLVRALLAYEKTRQGEDLEALPPALRRRIAEARKSKKPLEILLGEEAGVNLDAQSRKARRTLGQLVLGRAAERAFEEIYRSEVLPSEFTLVDLREERNATDYRLLNGGSRPVFRLNIKFFGSTFRRASELVGLDPLDCFPLATYKIHLALQKQVAEHLPYVFVVVGVEGLTTETVANNLDSNLINPLAQLLASPRMSSKRSIEDRVIDMLERQRDPTFVSAFDQISKSRWSVLSARRAEKLLKDKLFERAYALRVRGFAQQFRNAELDMHFSIQKDMTPLAKFLTVIREGGVQRATSMLERGDM